jgi:hypothetical protein
MTCSIAALHVVAWVPALEWRLFGKLDFIFIHFYIDSFVLKFLLFGNF